MIDPIAQHKVFKLFQLQSSPLSCLLNFFSICKEPESKTSVIFAFIYLIELVVCNWVKFLIWDLGSEAVFVCGFSEEILATTST